MHALGRLSWPGFLLIFNKTIDQLMLIVNMNRLKGLSEPVGVPLSAFRILDREFCRAFRAGLLPR
jgi:hypothetical protein